jgi:hypothetical protein
MSDRREQIIAELRAAILELGLRPSHLFVTRQRPTRDDDAIGHERERRVQIVLREMAKHGLTVHDVCTGWMLLPAPDSTFSLSNEIKIKREQA